MDHCTSDEFEAWCDQLAALLMEHEPRVCGSVACDLDKRTMQVDIYGQQVKRLLEELTLLAEYKASTEAAKRRMQDPKFMAQVQERIRVLDERRVAEEA